MAVNNYGSGMSVPSKEARISKLSSDDSIDKHLTEILILIENVPTTIFHCRDKERHLEGLLKVLRQDELLKCEKSQTIALRYLLGSLYINFEKFWTPTIRVILELIKQSRFQANLIRTLLDHLRETNSIIYEECEAITCLEDRPDHILHRNFLFQLLTNFQSFLNKENELFINEFLKFAEKELHVSPFIELYNRDNLISKKAALVKKPTIQKKKSRETLLATIKIFQSFEDHRKIHRSNEIKQLFLNLLCCRDGSIQKAAFNCIVVFDEENLKPHIEKVSRIISDKMVKTELTLFSIGDESINRSQLMPILLRILFGKMLGKIGRKSSGKNKAEHRKDLVMRFISDCNQEEIEYFFGLLFDPIFKYSKIQYNVLESALIQDLDLQNYIPLNKLHAILTSLSSFMKTVAHRKEEILNQVLKLINVVMFLVNHPLDNHQLLSQITERNIELLKNLKRFTMNTVCEFFAMFTYYRFDQQEINFIFKHIVWNSSQDFVNRNHATQTPILKLIASFASNRAYHPLLVKRNTVKKDEYLLHYIIQLYCEPKTTRTVNKFIGSILADIIDPERSIQVEDQEDEEAKRKMQNVEVLMDVDSVIPEYDPTKFNFQDELKYNENILIHYIGDIFEVLKRNCQTFVDKKDIENRLENYELLLLASLSKYLKDSKQSLLGVRLLLTTLPYQKKPNLIMTTLKTVQSLIQHIDKLDDRSIITLVGEFLSFQRNQDQRKELCKIIELLSNIDSNLIEAARAIDLMNRYAGDMLDHIDFEKCNEGYQISFKFIDHLDEIKINNPEVVRDSILLLVYQSCFIIDNIDKYEFTIRENCSIFFEKLASKLALIDLTRNGDFSSQIIESIILNKFIKKGLKESNEAVKHSFIGILRSFAIHCHEKNKTLRELHKFCNTNEDLDFWLNIKHIQLHNRSRALARIITNEYINETSTKTLSGYIMPLAAGFLFTKTYKSVSTLAENSIKLIGLICRHLNWVTYESTLSYYLSLLTKANATYQRTNIKLITEILKNFNYDITSCEEAMKDKEENAKLEKRMKKRKGTQADEDDSAVIATNAPTGKKLSPSTAKMIYFGVTKKLIPKLNSCFHEMTRVEFEHDKNMAEYLPEKDEIKRVPIAYAIVQLLNLLPNRYIMYRDHLPILFLKLCSFLKSKNEDIRKAARSTLIKIMSFVGPAYMPDFLRVLKQNLDKGFQIHVLNYTIHSVLDKMPLDYGSLDSSAEELVKSCFQEIFGRIAEDKDIAQILAKTYEAKKTKSYDTLFILASHISAEKFDLLMNNIKAVLKTSDEGKKVNKLSQCIQKVFNGLAQNESFPLDKLLKLIHELIVENIPNLRVRERIDLPSNKQKCNPAIREDRFLIGKDFSRVRLQSKINEKGNSHMIVENCLRLLLLTFENKKTLIKGEQKKKLDDFIALLTTCLKSTSPRCVTRALKCIHFIVLAKPDSPTFKVKTNSIVKKIFILLSLYNGVGMVQGDNFDMIAMCFKTLTLLLIRGENCKLNEEQVRVLMTYIEQDLNDANRQATAFGALHSLLQKKYDSPELGAIMFKVGELLVTSEDDSVRALSIKIWQTYLLDYNHPPQKLQSYLTKFLRQLDYEHIDGRKSILKMLTVIVTKFPENLLRDYFDLIFHLLAQRVVNEETKEVRQIVGKLIGVLLQRLPDQQNLIFDKFVLVWATNSSSEPLKLLGIKLISIYLESCKGVFKSGKDKIKRTLKTISGTLSNKKLNNETDSETIPSSNIITMEDKLNYHSLRLFKRLLDKSLISPLENALTTELSKIWHNISSQRLSDSHLPIVLTSCQLYLTFIKKTDLSNALNASNPTTDNYLEWNAKQIVRTLCDKFIDLLDRVEESEQLLAHITQCMILLGQMVARSNSTLSFEEAYLGSFENKNILEYFLNCKELPDNGFAKEHLPYDLNQSKKRLDLAWLSIKVVMQARKEAALYRLSKYFRRNFVLSWVASIAQELTGCRIHPYVVLFCMTPVRELTDKGLSDVCIKGLSEDLLKFIKGLMNHQLFTKIYSRLQLHFTSKRIDRKKKILLDKVTNPQKGTKRKTVENMKKTAKRKFKKQKS